MMREMVKLEGEREGRDIGWGVEYLRGVMKGEWRGLVMREL